MWEHHFASKKQIEDHLPEMVVQKVCVENFTLRVLNITKLSKHKTVEGSL